MRYVLAILFALMAVPALAQSDQHWQFQQDLHQLQNDQWWQQQHEQYGPPDWLQRDQDERDVQADTDRLQSDLNADGDE